jgi:methyltransferase family protein
MAPGRAVSAEPRPGNFAESKAMSRRAGAFWTERKVAWYRRAVARSDYGAAVIGTLAHALADCESALDVGAGCGALSLPLAGRLRHVTALEPAPAMAKALRHETAARGLANVEVVEAAWGEAPLSPHDLVLCAHVGELLRPGAAFLREVSGAARRWVALVRDASPELGEAADKFFFGELYPRLLGRPYETGCPKPMETVERLQVLGITPEVTAIRYRSDQPFDDLEEACDFWQEYLGLAPGAERAFLRSYLAERLIREEEGWLAPYTKRALVIAWRVDG